MDKFMALLLFCVVMLIPYAIWQAIVEKNEWNQFKVDHKCKVVSHITGDTFTTIDGKGNVGIGSTDSKTGWLCDDGVTYVR